MRMKWKEVVIVLIAIAFVATNIFWWQQSTGYAQKLAQFQREVVKTDEVRVLLEQKIIELEQRPEVPVVVEKPVYVEKIV